jgi:hypothetical protein
VTWFKLISIQKKNEVEKLARVGSSAVEVDARKLRCIIHRAYIFGLNDLSLDVGGGERQVSLHWCVDLICICQFMGIFRDDFDRVCDSMWPYHLLCCSVRGRDVPSDVDPNIRSNSHFYTCMWRDNSSWTPPWCLTQFHRKWYQRQLPWNTSSWLNETMIHHCKEHMVLRRVYHYCMYYSTVQYRTDQLSYVCHQLTRYVLISSWDVVMSVLLNTV